MKANLHGCNGVRMVIQIDKTLFLISFFQISHHLP
jgi:hypothetical protein